MTKAGRDASRGGAGIEADPDRILGRVCETVDTLFDIAASHDGLVPSILKLDGSGQMEGLPPAIPGQRDNDRAPGGCNLMHDESLLLTANALSAAGYGERYANGTQCYLDTFTGCCTGTVSGLFPWGEHSYWHLAEQRVGDSYQNVSPAQEYRPIHDHLRACPLWLWHAFQSRNPAVVQRFADGLDNHWVGEHREEYIRHARIMEVMRHPRNSRSCDFARHGGFYMVDWGFALSHQPRPEIRDQILCMLDYWWDRRDALDLVAFESRQPEGEPRMNLIGQTLSLAASLFEAADLLETAEPAMASTMRERAHVYTGGFLKGPHDISKRVFALSSYREDNRLHRAMPVWGSAYGIWPASYVGLTALMVWRETRHQGIWDWAEAVGRSYLETPLDEAVAAAPFDPRVTVVKDRLDDTPRPPAMDAGLGLGLLAELYACSGEECWLTGGLQLAQTLMDRYLDHPLPRGAEGIAWYESQMGPGFLLHGLARLALLAKTGREACPLEADFTCR